MSIKPCIALSPTPSEFAPLYYSGDLQKGMEVASELGYEGVELNIKDSDQLDQTSLISDLTRLGLSLVSIGTGQAYFAEGLSLADLDNQVQKKVRDRMKGHIRFASKVGAQVVIGSVRGRLDTSSAQKQDAGYQMVLDAARELARYAGGLGVKLTIEPINRYETNLINTVRDALVFIDQVGEENVGVIVDTFHMNIEEPNLVESINLAGDRVFHCHFADSNRYAIGMGHVDFPSVVKTLKRLNYFGFASAEAVPVPDDLTSAKRWIRAFYELIESVS